MINSSYNVLQLSDEEYKTYYENAKKYLRSEEEKNVDIDYFTPHGYSHSAAVEAIVNEMLKNCSTPAYKEDFRLTEVEKFLLSAAIWTHDLGMISKIAKEYYDECGDSYSIRKARDDHDKISAWHLLKNYRAVFLGGCHERGDKTEEEFRDKKCEGHVDIMNLIIKYHRRKTDIEECPDEVYLGEERIRCRLLACFLRLGDTLNIDSSRYDSKMYNILLHGDFNRESRLHWLKSCVISNVHPDAKNQQVIVNVHLPETSGCEKEKKGSEEEEKDDERNLKELIKRDFDEDLIAVRETFRRYSLPIYVKTEVTVSRIPGFDKNKRSDIAGLLSDLDLKSSLTSTQVIDDSLDSIYHLGNMNNYQYNKFYYQLDQLIRHLESVHRERPCHVGLIKIIEETRAIFRTLPEKDSAEVQASVVECAQKKLKILFDDIKEMRKRAKERIITQNNVRFLDDVKNIFLFGHSATIRDLLKKHAEESHRKVWEDDYIYVFECAAKRRFSAENCLEYNDGIYYASKIRDLGFRNVTIIPDMMFATILSKDTRDPHGKKVMSPINGSNSVVLIGANGIDTFLFETKIADKALDKIIGKDLDKAISESLTSRHIDESKIFDCNECVKTTIKDLNEEIKKYNENWGTCLKPIDEHAPRFEEELCLKWTILDKNEGGPNEKPKKYIIKKGKEGSLQVYLGSDCDKPFEICSNNEESLNREEITESLKREFRNKGHPLSPNSKFEEEETEQETCYVLDDLSILLKEEMKIKVYKDDTPYCSIDGKLLKCLEEIGQCDNKRGNDLAYCLKEELKEKLRLSDEFRIDDFKNFRIERKKDEWHLESDKVKFVLKNCSRIKVYESYCTLSKEEIKELENIDIFNDNIMEYMFSWDKILEEKDNERLVDFLTKKFGINWIKNENAKIEKIDNGMAIKASTEKNVLLLKLNERKTEAILEIDGEKKDEFTAKMENGKLNIYKNKNLVDSLKDALVKEKQDKLSLDEINPQFEEIKITHDDVLIARFTEYSGNQSHKLKVVRNGGKLYIYRKYDKEYKLIDISSKDPLSDKDNLKDIPLGLLKELERKGLKTPPGAKIRRIASDWWSIDSSKLALILDESCIKVYKDSKPYCNLDRKFKEINWDDKRIKSIEGLGEDLKNELTGKLKVCDKAEIIKVDDSHWRIEPGGFEVVFREERIKVYKELGAYCSLDKKFLEMLDKSSKPRQITGLSAELPERSSSIRREMLEICDKWIPDYPGLNLPCKGLVDELAKNKIALSRSSAIKLHPPGVESSCECCEESCGAVKCWTIDDIQKKLYKIQRARGKQELNVYRLDNGPSGHTSGHLMVTRIAKEFKIPVVLIADSFKMGRIDWKLSKKRDGEWLTTQKNFVNDLLGKDGKCSRGAMIETVNYREERVPEELISRIISEDTPPIADIEDLNDETPED